MRVAYLTSVYPSVSHTFIRRELTEVERQLGEVTRLAIRKTPYAIVDREDASENGRTFRAFAQPPRRWLAALLARGLAHPVASLRGLGKALRLARTGHRGWVRHCAYYLEALLLLDEVARDGVQHVHVHFGTNPAAVAQIMRAMGGPPFSFTVHGPDEFDAPHGFALASKARDAAFVVAISHYCSAQLQRWIPRDEWHKIQIVRCGVGDDFLEQAQPLDPDSRTLVCIGRFSAQKGQLLLLEAFADALERGLDARLVLVGDGELRPELEALIARRGLAQHVRLTGWLDEAAVRRELLACRALVLPSFAEGLPMVIMEAFALGRPVLSTYVAGIPELVHAADNGWLIPAGHRGALADALLAVMQAPVAELATKAARGREVVLRQHYTPAEAAKLAAHIRRAAQLELAGMLA